MGSSTLHYRRPYSNKAADVRTVTGPPLVSYLGETLIDGLGIITDITTNRKTSASEHSVCLMRLPKEIADLVLLDGTSCT